MTIDTHELTRGSRVSYGDERLRLIATVQSDIGPLCVVGHADDDASAVGVLIPQVDLLADGELTPEQTDEDRENANAVPVATDETVPPQTPTPPSDPPANTTPTPPAEPDASGDPASAQPSQSTGGAAA